MRIAWSSRYTNADFPFNYEDWSFDDKVRLFEDQVLGWQLLIANDIINTHAAENRHAGFAVLAMVLSYFEMMGKYLEGYTGEKKSGKHFKIGLMSVFPDLGGMNKVANVLYGDARCGMYHEALIGKRILLTRNYDTPIFVINKEYSIIAIDPHTLVTALINHFQEYTGKLKKSSHESTLRRNFVARFDFIKRSKASIQRNMVVDSAELFS